VRHGLGLGARQHPRKTVRTPQPPQSDAAVVAATAVVADEPEKSPGPFGIAPITWQKILPLGFMFFCILFNYTILRDTKVTPPPHFFSCIHTPSPSALLIQLDPR